MNNLEQINSENKIEKIITHNGIFHTDEVFATAILKDLFPESMELHSGGKIDFVKYIRERNPKTIKENTKSESTLMLDYGQSYNPELFNYDHHQENGAGERENGIGYASAGLIWKHFGKEWITYIDVYTRKLSLTEEEKDFIFNEIDKTYVQLIDSNDTGQMEDVTYTMSDGTKIKGNQFTIPEIVRLANIDTYDGKNKDQKFNDVVELFRSITFSMVQKQINLIEGLRNLDYSKIELSENGKTMIIKDGIAHEVINHILFNDNKFKNVEFFVSIPKKGNISINVVPKAIGVREYRNPDMIPEILRIGEDPQELNKILGIENGMLFVHTSGFFAQCKNIETAKKLLEYCSK